MKKSRFKNKSLFPFILSLFAVAKKYSLFFIFILCVLFVGAISVYKVFIQKPTYVYARVKVGQGYWWASTQKPSLWYVQAIQKAKEEKDLTGDPIAKILKVAYYPWYGSNQFDVFVTLQLKVTKIGKTGQYNFKRETIGVSSPIDLEFPHVQFSGTIIDLSEKPPSTELVSKTVYLTKKFIYPWEYDQIHVGDYFNDGNSNVVEIVEKAKGETNEVLVNELGKLLSSETESYRYVMLKVRMRLRPEGGQYLYGDEIVVSPGRTLGFVTNNFTFNDYVVAKIE
jgi:hypothetical protein